MIFTELKLKGAFLIEPEKKIDDRGYFSRTFCVKEFKKYNLETNIMQMSSSYNKKKGQIRGMHYQAAPHQETKIVRCTKGSIYDVIVDLRHNSATYMQSANAILSEENGHTLYIPKGFAHGFRTLESNSIVFYMMDELYHPAAARELNYRDFFNEYN